MQESMLFSNLLNNNSDAYFQQIHFTINGELNIEAVQKAIDILVFRHDILRTTFIYKNSKRPVQVVLKERKIKLNYENIYHLEQKEKSEYIEMFKVKDINNEFNLLKDSLLRVNILDCGAGNLEIIISFHHIILDGWSLGNILSEFKEIYEHILNDKKYKDDDVNQFSSYIRWIEEQDKNQALEYWEEHLSNYEQLTSVPRIKRKLDSNEYKAEQLFYDFETGITSGVESIARKNGVTLSTVLHILWGILLNKYNNTNDSIFASVVSGRPSDIPEIEKMVGMFINSIPFRVKYEDDMTFTNLLKEVWENTRNSNKFDYISLAEIQSKSSLKNNLIDHAMVFENYPLSEKILYEKDTSLGFQIKNISIYGHPNYDFNIVITPKEEAISIKASYNANVYDKEYVINIIQNFERICGTVAENQEVILKDLEIVGGLEKEKLLYDFNNTTKKSASMEVFYKTFEREVEKNPNKIVIISNEEKLTFSELNKKSNQLARTLIDNGMSKNSVIAIIVEPSVQTIIGILSVLKAGGAYVPIDSTYPKDRINFILKDSCACALLTSGEHKDITNIEDIHVFNLKNDDLYTGDDSNLGQDVNLNDPIYVIYTSGTTGVPKGVEVSNKNVVNYVNWFKNKVNLSSRDSTAILSSLAFDLSYTSLYSALSTGCEIHIIDKNIYSDPDILLKYINENKVTYIKGTPSLFSAMVNCRSFIDRKVCESLRLIVLGGEEINTVDIEKYNSVYPNAKVMNHYGPTECTIGTISTLINFDKFQEYKNMPYIGRPIDNSRAYILDSKYKIKPIGAIGELYISGEGVTLGYLNNDQLTKEKFISNPFLREDVMYKTGDLARWLPSGDIEFVGRIDNQVKIRGFRVETGEVRNQLQKHWLIEETAVIDRKDINGNKYLCAYLVSAKDISVSELRDFLSKTLPDYMIPSHFIRIDRIPLTPNGKLDRNKLPSFDSNMISGVEYVPARNINEEKMINIWSKNLGIEKIGISNNFFELGGHSLKAIMLTADIYKEFGVDVPLKILFDQPTIRQISEYIAEKEAKDNIQIKPSEKREYYVASSAQKRIYTLCKYDNNNINYNMPSAMEIEGILDIDKINNALKQLVSRHEAFRTSFEIIDGEIVQRVHEKCNINLEHYTLQGKQQEFLKGLIKPFDLNNDSLIRIAIIRVDEDKNILFTDMHHIISDGVSISIFFKELFQLYNNEALGEKELEYKDYSQWQKEYRNSEYFKDSEKFWEKHLSGELPVMNLPIDHPRQNVKSFEGDYINFSVSGLEYENLRSIAYDTGTTTFMILYSIECLLLSKYTSQEDIIVGSVSAGRKQKEIQDVIGMFVNTLAIRTYPKGEKTFRKFLLEVKETILEVFDNQDYQFEEIIDKLKIKTEASRNALFDTLFSYENVSDYEFGINGLKIKAVDLEYKVSKFDLSLMAEEKKDGLYFRLEYNCELFNRDTVERFKTNFLNLLTKIPSQINNKLSEIEIVNEEEKELLLYKFNQTDAEYPHEKTIKEIFEEQVEKTPYNIAISFEGSELTYRELNSKANSIGRLLRDAGIKRDDIVAIMVERSPEMIIGALGVVKAGGAYLPLDPKFPRERIEYMLQDSNASVLLTTSILGAGIDFHGHQINMDDDRNYVLNEENLTNVNEPNDILYIIYTSGTTGRPKGVMIEHRNVVRLLFNDKCLFDFDEKDVWTMFHSFCFDFSVWEMYGALLYGGKLVVVSKIIAQDTRAYLKLLKTEKVTILNQTPTAFYSLIKEELQEEDSSLCLRYIIFGGEALKPMRLKEWKDRYQNTRLINMYGITETTVHVTYKEITDYEIQMNISNIGVPIPTLKTYIFDRDMKLLPIGVPGELCVGGAGVARGYLNRSELTADKFVYNPYNGEERIYKSGDLVRYLSSGEMEYLGRIDHQVKIRGFRIELGEIEKHLLNHDDVIDATVVHKEDQLGENCICAYFVSNFPVKIGELREYMTKELPDYMVPSYFMQVDMIPITSNGKVDRAALPDIDASRYIGEEYQAPSNNIEEQLVEVWKSILGLEKIGVKDNFFELGGHSLKAMLLVSTILKIFEVEITLRKFFEMPTIEKQAEFISRAKRCSISSIEKSEEKDFYMVSAAQKRIFAMSQFEPNSINYNVPTIVKIEGLIDSEKLEKAFTKIIERHEALRTTFDFVDEMLVQKIHKSSDFNLEYEIIEGYQEEDVNASISQFIRPFSLSSGSLIRAKLFGSNSEKSILAIDMHHIICDGISKKLFIKELFTLYSDKQLEELKLQYKDFAEWQNEMYRSGEMKKYEDYWMNQFKGELPVLNISTDYKRPSVQSFEGDYFEFLISKEASANLKTIALECGCTLNIVLLAAYNILLSKYSGQEDIIVGIVTSGRTNNSLNNTLGMFVNTLALRNYPCADKTFTEFLKEVKNNFLDAVDNQEYPFDEIIDKLGLIRDISRNPLFDTVFTYENSTIPEENFNGIAIKTEEVDYKSAKFDLAIVAEDKGDSIKFVINYCTKLFKRETISRLGRYYQNILSEIIDNIDLDIANLQLIGNEEKEKIIFDFNNNILEYPMDKSIIDLFEEQVERMPENVAIVESETKLTYDELNKKANKLARSLKKVGVTTESIVGIIAEAGIEFIVGILGVLKAGGTYLPIDPVYPKDRIRFMIRDSGLNTLVTKGSLIEDLEFDGNQILLDDESIENNDCSNLDNVIKSNNLAYVIYTSGSTGRPKGVMIEHKALVNLCYWHNKQYEVTYQDRATKYAGVGFDASVWEIFPYLICGASLYIVSNELRMDVSKLNEYFEENKISIAFVPTQICEQFMGIGNESLRILLTGGDKLKRFVKGKYKLFNNYGPTENTVVTTFCHIDRLYDNIPIGRPISNNRIYIVDSANRLLPISVAGEICIAGDSLSRGYLNNAQLTSEKFVPNPFEDKGLMYRTGDMARWMDDGTIEFLGRIDNQVKIRGNRIEIGEIESQLLKIGGIKEAAVFCKEDSNQNKYLCAYVVANKEIKSLELKRDLSKELPEYMIPAYMVQIDAMPVNANGKIDRKSLAAIDIRINKVNEYEPPKDELEEKLVDIWSEILNVEKIGVNDNFFELGGDSLKAILLMSKIQKVLDTKIGIADIFKECTIRRLSVQLINRKQDSISAIRKVGELEGYPKGCYPLSSAQKRMFILSRMQNTGTLYNTPIAFKIYGELDLERLREAFNYIIKRHEALRTSFHVINNKPVQMVHDEVIFEPAYIQISEENVETEIRNFIREFDLSQYPQIRVKVIEIRSEYRILLIDMPHIVSDGVSAGIIMGEFAKLYEGKILSDPELQYKDFAVWQDEMIESGMMKEQEEYWLDKLKGDIPFIEMPTDYPRPIINTYEGITNIYELDEDLSKKLKSVSLNYKATLFMTLLSGYNILLHKYTGNKDIIVGCGVAGRHHPGTDKIVGMFVNTLAMKNSVNRDKSFKEILLDVKENSLEAYKNQDYPFDLLVEKVGGKRDSNRNPIFSTLFELQESENSQVNISEIRMESFYIQPYISKFDFAVFVLEEDKKIKLYINYSTNLFKADTIDKLFDNYVKILKTVTDETNILIKDINIFDEDEYEKLENVMDNELSFNF
ncbi:MAG: amino acid adenylation domain protein [Anaerocolumna sp.]|nr:amino acid adenylation domain protein [Anaerocolumna sp.]